jgi:plastocyanin
LGGDIILAIDNMTVRKIDDLLGYLEASTHLGETVTITIWRDGGESGNGTFTADQEGVFPYYCIYHLPTMTGELVVLPPEPSGAAAPAT